MIRKGGGPEERGDSVHDQRSVAKRGIPVAGAGGFISGNLVRTLVPSGCSDIRCFDINRWTSSRYFLPSPACVYAADKQQSAEVTAFVDIVEQIAGGRSGGGMTAPLLRVCVD